MTALDLISYQHALRAAEAEAARVLAHRSGLEIELSPDPSDEAQYSVERDLAAHSLTAESRLLAAVRSALERIAYGAYGICQHCNQQISPKRLTALPWAAYCVTCQESRDCKTYRNRTPDLREKRAA